MSLSLKNSSWRGSSFHCVRYKQTHNVLRDNGTLIVQERNWHSHSFKFREIIMVNYYHSDQQVFLLKTGSYTIIELAEYGKILKTSGDIVKLRRRHQSYFFFACGFGIECELMSSCSICGIKEASRNTFCQICYLVFHLCSFSLVLFLLSVVYIQSRADAKHKQLASWTIFTSVVV